MFDHLSAFQTAKLWLTDHTGLAKDALHVYVGLLALLGAARLFKWRVGDWRPWLVVLGLALAGEAWDIRDVLVVHIEPDFWASWHDVWNTCLWPGILTLLARHSDMFRRSQITE